MKEQNMLSQFLRFLSNYNICYLQAFRLSLFFPLFIIFYPSDPMRTTIQKQKFTSALKDMMNRVSTQISSQFLKEQKEDQPLISIINFDSFNVQGLQSINKPAKKVNLFPTFYVHRSKYQSKALRFSTQNRKNSQESQQRYAKFKSERARNLSLKRQSQHSQFVQAETLQKTKDYQEIEKQKFQKSKHQSCNKTQCYSPKKAFQNDLIENIKTLRKKQSVFVRQDVQNHKNKALSSQNKRAKASQSLMMEFKPEQLALGQGWKRQEALYKLKMQIKNKVFRRRMYRQVNQKNQYFKENTVKIRSLSNEKEKIRSSDSFLNAQECAIAQKKQKNNLKTLQTKNVKIYTIPVLQHDLSMKISSKPAQIVGDILKCKQQYIRNNSLNKLQKTLRIGNGNNTFSCFNQFSVQNPEQIDQFFAKKQLTRRQKRVKTEKNGNNLSINQGQNMFRILTPWRDNPNQWKL